MTVSSWRFRVLTGPVSVCVCVYTLDGDRLSCDCSFLRRALLIGVIDSICRGKERNVTNSTQLNVPLHFPPQDIFHSSGEKA